jgi:hypothetical protein
MDRLLPDAWRPAVRYLAWVLVTLAWASAVFLGMREMWAYESRPGAAAAAPVRIGSDSGVGPHRPSLIVLAHPRCPCTGATLDELDELMTRAGDALTARVYFYYPSAKNASWARSQLWSRAGRIPGVEVIADSDGSEARRLGAKTSGQALLYGADGTLLFSGGLTDSRGHAGESAGRRAVLSLVADERQARSATPVFGCSILGSPKNGKGFSSP